MRRGTGRPLPLRSGAASRARHAKRAGVNLAADERAAHAARNPPFHTTRPHRLRRVRSTRQQPLSRGERCSTLARFPGPPAPTLGGVCDDLGSEDYPEDEPPEEDELDEEDMAELARDLLGPRPVRRDVSARRCRRRRPRADPGRTRALRAGDSCTVYAEPEGCPWTRSRSAIEDLARIVGVASELEFASEDRAGLHYHFPHGVLHVDPAERTFPWPTAERVGRGGRAGGQQLLGREAGLAAPTQSASESTSSPSASTVTSAADAVVVVFNALPADEQDTLFERLQQAAVGDQGTSAPSSAIHTETCSGLPGSRNGASWCHGFADPTRGGLYHSTEPLSSTASRQSTPVRQNRECRSVRLTASIDARKEGTPMTSRDLLLIANLRIGKPPPRTTILGRTARRDGISAVPRR